MRDARTPLLLASIAAAAALVGGCAMFDPAALPAGTSISDARAKLGPPTGEHAIGAGTRLEYATGPFGKTTWMLDFDGAGTLKASRQVLTEAQFNALRAGMGEAEVRGAIGRPGETWRLARQRQNVWVYRYQSPFCVVFQVGMGDDGRVVDTGYAPDPLCELKDISPLGR